MIEIKSINKAFEGTKILHDISFSVQKGSIYGLLGSNGAGKTTLLKTIAGVLKPESGEVSVNTQPVYENIPTKETLFFIPDQPFFFAHYSLTQMARFYQNTYSRWDEDRFQSLSKLFGIDPHKSLHKFSKGVQRQAAFILALATQPDVLILDEPMDGLDPVVRKKAKSVLISEVANRDMTIIISSHNLREVEDICDHIGILHEGEFLLEKELDDLKSGIHKVQLAFKGAIPEQLFSDLDILHNETRGSVSLCIVRGDEQRVRSLIQPYRPVIFDLLPLTLEEIFVYEMEDVGYAIQTSWINKEIIVQSLRNVGWVGIVYFIGLLFSLPVDIIGQLSKDQQRYPVAIYENLFKMQYPIQIGLLLIIPVILSLFLFRYLHVKQAGDFMHSLPITRRKLFFHFTGTGFGILILPVLLNTVILLSLYSFTDLQQYIGVQDIFVWGGITILMSVLLFTASTFVAMVTGLTAVHGALTYILLLLPAGMFMLVCYSLKNLLFGFPEDYFFNVQIEKYSPLIKTVYLENDLLSGTDVLLFILITLVFYGFSYVLYKIRKVETVSQAIVYPFLRPLFKYGISFCFMLLGGMYFNGIYQSQGWTLFGYFFGSLIGYYIGEMILQKHWRVFRQWKGYAGFAIVIVLLGFIIQFDLFQYEEKVPELADVEKVHVSQSYYSLTDNPENLIKDPFMTDPKAIETVLNLHEAIVDHQNHKNRADEKNEQIFLYYKMKDGSKIVRNYLIDIEDVRSQYASLYEMKNYKEKTEQLYSVDSDKVDKLTIYNEMGNKPAITIADPADIEEAINTLKEETYDDSFENRDKINLYNVEFLMSKDTWANTGVKKNDKKFIAWLEDKGYLKDLKMTASDIEWMYVTQPVDYNDPFSQPVEEAVLELKKENKGIEVKDAEQIESIMDELVYDHMNSAYTVIIKYKNQGSIQTLGLQKEDAPSFIKRELND